MRAGASFTQCTRTDIQLPIVTDAVVYNNSKTKKCDGLYPNVWILFVSLFSNKNILNQFTFPIVHDSFFLL